MAKGFNLEPLEDRIVVRPSEEGNIGSINDHWVSDKYSVRDTTPSVADAITSD